MGTSTIPLPEDLRSVSRSVLEEYVFGRIRQFSQVFSGLLSPNTNGQVVEQCFQQAYQQTAQTTSTDNAIVRFRHRCKFLGCMRKECMLCKNNPNKRCADADCLDECFADMQVLKSKCDSDVYLELVDPHTGQAQSIPGLELQVSVIDGESWSESTPNVFNNIRELLKSDEGQPLLSSLMAGTRTDQYGRLFLRLQDGYARLPDVLVTDKNDTFHLNGGSYSAFRLMARAMKRDLYGNVTPVDAIPPAITGKFVVKTQRALNDYRKSEYPHYKDELTKLKFIGSITAQRLRDIQTHLGFEVPFTSIETVEQLKHLMLYADQNRQVENKLLELLNMKGKHKHKWDYLREVLFEKIVYDDMVHRAWYTDESMQQGLLFACKQAQINLEKPIGIIRRVNQNGQACLQVFTAPDGQAAETMKAWKVAAEQAWVAQGHNGWTMVQDRMELLNNSGPAVVIPGTAASLHTVLSGGISTAMSQQDGMEEGHQVLYPRGSNGVASPLSQRRSETPPSLRHANSVGRANSIGVAVPGPSAQMDFQFAPSNSGGMPQQQTMPDPFRQGNDPMGGVFQFTSAPRPTGTVITSGVMMQGMQQGGDQMLQADVYRTASVPGRAPQMAPAVAGMDGGGIRSRSGRFRRNSAPTDAVGLAAQLPQIQVPARPFTPEGYFEPSMELSFNKRPRASAPSGLFNDEMMGAGGDQMYGAPQQTDDRAAMDRARLTFYHQESRGRHLPRSRTSQENLASSPISNVFDRAEAELDRLLEGMPALDGNAFGMKAEGGGSPATDHVMLTMQNLGGMGGGGMHSLSGSAPQMSDLMAAHMGSMGHAANAAAAQAAAMGGQQMGDSTQRLSATMQQALHLGQEHAGAGLVGVPAPAIDARAFMFQESDSFNKTIARVLQHSESDSFKRLLAGPLSPSGGHPDPGFERALDDLLQQGQL